MDNLTEKFDIKVLIVEDDAPSLQFVALLIKKIVNYVYTATNGIEGIEQFNKYEPDIIVSDIAMPEMNGIEMIKEIKKIKPNIYTILTTAFDNKNILMNAIGTGINQFIVKPVRKTQLEEAVKNAADIVTLQQKVEIQYERIKYLSNAIQASSSIVCILKKDFSIEYANPTFEKIAFNYFDNSSENNILFYFDTDINKTDYEKFTQALSYKTEFKGELIFRTNTKNIWVTASLSPIMVDSGTIMHYVLVMEDITQQKVIEFHLEESVDILEEKVKERTRELEKSNQTLIEEIETRKKIEIELIKAKDIAEKADKAKSLFLAKVSHELRTPMNGILGMTSLILDSPHNEKQRKSLEIVKSSGEHLLSIINDLLDYSKFQNGGFTLKNVQFKLEHLITQTFELIDHQAKSKNLEILFNIDESANIDYFADSYRLQQILLNLLVNAIKYTPKGSIHLDVKLKSKTDTTYELLFSIKDTGIGIAEDKKSILFDPFSQAENLMTRRYGGIGLGLTITKELVSMFNGKIWFESQVGLGSIFFFTCKLNLSNSLKLPHEIDFHQNIDFVRPPYILLAEDSQINIEVFKGFMEQYPHKLDIATDGQEALGLINSNKYDLIFIDLMMPQMDGVTLVHKIKSSANPNEKTPLVAISANVSKELEAPLVQAGFNCSLPKPYSKSEIEQIFKKFLKGFIANNKKLKDNITAVKHTNIDLSNLLDTINYNFASFEKLISYFLEHYSNNITNLHKAAFSGDMKSFSAIVHKYKSELGLLGAINTIEIIKEYERLIKMNQDIDLIAYYERIYNEIEQITLALKTQSIEELFKLYKG